MTTQQLAGLLPGQSVQLCCRTTSANIFYSGPAEADRKLFRPSCAEAQLKPVNYTVEGEFMGIEEGKIDYLVMLTQGEAAVLGMRRGFLKVIGTEIRFKVVHVPISAIRKVKSHA